MATTRAADIEFKETCDEARQRVAKVLRGLMAWHQMGEPELAAIMGLSRQAVNNRLRGKTGIGAEEVAAFARIFSVPVDVFYAERPEEFIASSRCTARGSRPPMVGARVDLDYLMPTTVPA